MYTATGHYREAMAVHEEILRLVVEGDDGDDKIPDTVQPHMAKYHLDMLKRSYQRLGGWDKNQSVYNQLVDRLLSMPEYNDPVFKGVTGIEKWEAKAKVDDGMGQFEVPEKWEFIDPNLLNDNGDLIDRKYSGPSTCGLGVKRVTSNWGMGSVYEDLFGPLTNYKEPSGVAICEFPPADTYGAINPKTAPGGWACGGSFGGLQA